jgi:hypothetical protein
MPSVVGAPESKVAKTPGTPGGRDHLRLLETGIEQQLAHIIGALVTLTFSAAIVG